MTTASDASPPQPDSQRGFPLGSPSVWLPEFFAWLNASAPVDPRKQLAPQDVAHVALMPAEFAQIPGGAEWCEYRCVAVKRAQGVEFWCTQLRLPVLTSVAGLRGRVAWRLTSNTAALFK